MTDASSFDRRAVIRLLAEIRFQQATIHDKDVWYYCTGQLLAAKNRGRNDLSRVIRFTAHDFLAVTKRGTSGRSYERLILALQRLRGTSVVTNINRKGARLIWGFGLIDEWRIIERSRADNRMEAVSVTLPEWLWQSVLDTNIKTIPRDYFGLRKPLDRRIYELARKHCGSQPRWEVNLSTLYIKSGSQGDEREFCRMVRELAEQGTLLDYWIRWDGDRRKVLFYRSDSLGNAALMKELQARAKSSRKLRRRR